MRLNINKSDPAFFEEFGGAFVPETLIGPLNQVADHFANFIEDPECLAELDHLYKSYSGRPTPLTFAKNLTQSLGGAKIYLKREDLGHTGSHKINNALGQALLAKKMGKKHLIAETGAGQHGVATATVAAYFNMKCTVFMGAKDMERQSPNVKKMNLLGAEVRAVSSGNKTLKEAISEAMRFWVENLDDSYYLLGSALGPHPYPRMVRTFQRVIGLEAKEQIMALENQLPDLLVACVGGGSNAIGLFHPFLDTHVKMVGVEAGGQGISSGLHASRFQGGTLGVLQGCLTHILQDDNGQIRETYSISAGLDYAGVGPEHSLLQKKNRVEYTAALDLEALDAFKALTHHEGIIPALESSHALAETIKRAKKMSPSQIILCNLSGRGDKDLSALMERGDL